jgi:hypothetical protein
MISIDRLFYSIGYLRIVRSLLQEWLKKAKDFKSPAPQPEDPRSPLLLEMLVVAPYKAPEKKEKKKKTGRAGLRTKDQLEAESEETHASSNQEEEEEEEHEVEGGGDSPFTRKRATSPDALEDELPPAQKKARRSQVILSDDSSASDTESEGFKRVPRRTLRVKPPPRRYRSEDLANTKFR